MDKMFSIVVPVYNAEKYLKECLDSVVYQKFTDYELILVDDGSMDNSGAICDEYKNRYPELIKVIHKENEGPYIARQTGINASIGKYILFLDSDDMYYDGIFISMMEQIEHYNPDLVMFNLAYVSKDGDKYGERHIYSGKQVFYADSLNLLKNDFFNKSGFNELATKCIRKKLLNDTRKISLYKCINYAEDALVSARCIDKAEKVVYIDNALYGYRQNPCSTIHNMKFHEYKSYAFVQNQLDTLIDKWNIDKDTLCRVYENRIIFFLGMIRRLISGKYMYRCTCEQYCDAVELMLEHVCKYDGLKDVIIDLRFIDRLSILLALKGRTTLLYIWLKIIDFLSNIKNKNKL